MSAAPEEFADNGRFRVLGRLGQGGMGVVYRAFDRERGVEVALKTLQRLDAAAVYRLKQEFRTLADLSHPNLVGYHELFAAGDRVFFTMELVDGKDFYSWVCGDVVADPFAATSSLGDADTVISVETVDDPTTVAGTAPRAEGAIVHHEVNHERLRDGLAQLATAVHAVHAAGKLHRDIKPSNVMVTSEGRVVLLDFGLARDLVRQIAAGDENIEGTPGYMAPEQAQGLAAMPATDWYAVGVMLFEVLTGRLPFIGGLLSILHAKVRNDPPDPTSLAPDLPPDLAELCALLVRRDPAQRPTGQQVLQRLGAAVTQVAPPAPAASGEALLLGRAAQLGHLRRALAEVRGGKPATVFVQGPSGMGKSALLERFLGEARQAGALVLRGRCYEQESLPYKAFDALVDALSEDLAARSDAEVAMILPHEAHELARLFPVLRRVPAIAASPPRSEARDQGELRRRGFAAFRELVTRIARRGPLVLLIEDLQWADIDGLRLLVSLLSPPEAPPMLMLGSYRAEAATKNAAIAELVRHKDQGALGEVREIEIGPLSGEEAYQLALASMGTGGPLAEARARRIALESAGSPFFVGELVRYADAALDGRAPTLEDVVRARIAAMPYPVRRVLDVVALAGRPIPRRVVLDAAQVPDGASALAVLRAQSLVRTEGLRGEDYVACYHDRIREVVVARLDGVARPAAHAAIARALDAHGGADAELLAMHLLGAGDKARAGALARQAADQAAAALAFDRAARLYHLSYQLERPTGEAKRDLRRKLAASLVNAGRGGDAARAFLALAKDAPVAEALELRRRAAEQLLISGRLDEGKELLVAVLKDVDVDMPSSPGRTLAAFLARAAGLRLRGLDFKERAARDVPPAELARIDACFSAANGFTFSDPIRGAYFQSLHLGLALKAGEPFRIALGLANYGAHLSSEGLPNKERSAEIIGRARTIAERHDLALPLARATMAKGTAAFCQGRFSDAVAGLDETERLLRERCIGAYWELDGTHLWARLALWFAGDLPELRRRESAHRQDAEARHDLFVETWLGTSTSAALLLADDAPDKARATIQAALKRWTGRGFTSLHFLALWHATLVELYAGDGAAAYEAIASQWSAVEKALLLRIQICAVSLHQARGTAALAAAAAAKSKDEKAKLWKVAEKDAKSLEKQGVDYAVPFAGMLRSGLAAQSGRGEEAARLAEGAARQFDACAMKLFAVMARRRVGELRGDSTAVAAGDAALRSASVRDPGRWSRLG